MDITKLSSKELQGMTKRELKSNGFNESQIEAIKKGDVLSLSRYLANIPGNIEQRNMFLNYSRFVAAIEEAQTEVYEDSNDSGFGL